jgi:hypothetical protein
LKDNRLEEAIAAVEAGPGSGPPPLEPFGLVLWRDGSWTHDGQPILNRRLRERFDRAVVYVVEADVYVVQIGRFRGMIEVEETGFFVRSVDLDGDSIGLSDGSIETLDVGSLDRSRLDGALVCRIKRALVPDGLPARFLHSAQADLLAAVDDSSGHPGFRLGGRIAPLPLGLWDDGSD